MSIGGNGVSRRQLLGGLAAGAVGAALAACAGRPDHGDSIPADDPSAVSVDVPTPSPSSTHEEVPALPDVEAIIAEHEGLAPTAWGVDIDGVVATGGATGAPDAVFLTLDACGGEHGSGFDEALITGLIDAGVPASLFLNLRWIEEHPDVVADLVAEPLFSLQNHGSRHLPLSVSGASAYGIVGTANAREAALEVWDNHLALTELTGMEPEWFRPGTAHLDDVGLSIAAALGERVAGFAINGDAGATWPAEHVAAEVGGAAGGEFVIAHMNQPASGTAEGILRALPALRDRGLEFAKL